MRGVFTTKLSREDFISAYWLYTRWLWLWKRLAITIIIVAIVIALAFMAIDWFSYGLAPKILGRYLIDGVIDALIMTVVLVAITLFNLPRRLGRLYDDLCLAERETRREFDAVGLRSSNRDGTTLLEWDRFKFWIENETFLLFVLSRWNFVIVPKARIAEPVLADLRAAASAGGLTAR